MQYKGAVDNRTAKQKLQDFSSEEVTVFGAVTFFERDPVSYTVRDQDGSGSCVAQTVAKMLEVWRQKNSNEKKVYSATPIYQNRSNKPVAGMHYVDAFSQPIKKGIWTEQSVPSQHMNDSDMDNALVSSPSEEERPNAYLSVPTDFYVVASEVQKYGAVMVWFKCSYEEWCRDVPEGSSDSEAVRHSVTAVDTIVWKEVEYLIIEDSWGKWLKSSDVPLKDGQRAITKKFFDKHCFYSGEFTKFEYKKTEKPHYKFSRPLSFGQKLPEVEKLQAMLRYESFFPSNVPLTGYFGQITAKALRDWQVKHGIMDFAKETNITKVRFGTKSITEANKLYS